MSCRIYESQWENHCADPQVGVRLKDLRDLHELVAILCFTRTSHTKNP